MKNKKIMTIGGVEQYLNAVKKADRELEIAMHGKLISTRPTRVKKSKKVYDRKKFKKNV